MDAGSSLLPTVENMTSKQLSHVYHAMFTVSVSEEIVKSSMERVCGKGVHVASQSQILSVLQEIHDRRGEHSVSNPWILHIHIVCHFIQLICNSNKLY